jgi:hypothetical protein
MAKNALQDQVEASFEAFRESLQQLLAEQAQRSVDDAVKDLAKQSAPFRVEDVKVDVVIHGLTLRSSGQGAAAPARRTPAAKPRRRTSTAPAKGRPKRSRQSVRAALEEIFASASGPLDTDAIREQLESRGVRATPDNLHQQLRRLVQAGVVSREGRGVYRQQASAQAA